MSKLLRHLDNLYRLKARLLFNFTIGYNDVSLPIDAIRNVLLILAAIDILFKRTFAWWVDSLLVLLVFIGFTAWGHLLKRRGLTDYVNSIQNSVNPELKRINAIATKLGA